MNKFKLLAVALSLAFATNASAEVHYYSFGEKIAGSGPEEVNFAKLSFDDEFSKFTLTLSSEFASFFNSSNAFVGSMAVEYEGEGAYPVVTETFAGGGVAVVTTSSGGGPDGAFDFRYVFGGGNDKLMSNETVSWYSGPSSSAVNEHGKIKTIKIAGFDVENFDEVALHVQGLAGNKSGWYEMSEVSPVPETDTSAMMLMGLGLMGFIATRRRNDQA